MSDEQLIQRLREEVRDVKSCFTNFSFQASTLAAVAVGFILSEADQSPWVTLTAVPVIIVLMAVCRIGIFKYTTANRNLGYELHLDRLRVYARMNDPAVNARIEELRQIGWEEALRAWRVVQATMYASIHTVPQKPQDRSWYLRFVPFTGWLDPALHRERDIKTLLGEPTSRPAVTPTFVDKNDLMPLGDEPYEWWNQRKLTTFYDTSGVVAHYHTGNYLKDMLRALNVMQSTLYACLFWPLLTSAAGLHTSSIRRNLYGLAVLGFGVVMALRQRRLNSRRLILEDGLVSIHSSAITWAGVVIAHTIAANGAPRPYHHYTERLAAIARHIKVVQLPALIGHYVVDGHPIFDPGETLRERALTRRRGPRDRREHHSTAVRAASDERRDPQRSDRRIS